MAEFDDELDMQRELDTRDSLASMARYHVSSPGAVTTQVLPPSFIPTATGRIRPVTGTIPAIQSDAQKNRRRLAVPSDPYVRWLPARFVNRKIPMQTVVPTATTIEAP